jgi:amphi-Trp domain-containing protein
MSKEHILMRSEERQSVAQAAAFLRELADRLAAGQINLRQGDEELSLSVSGDVNLELKVEEEARASGRKMSLEIEIEWREGEEAGVRLA